MTKTIKVKITNTNATTLGCPKGVLPHAIHCAVAVEEILGNFQIENPRVRPRC